MHLTPTDKKIKNRGHCANYMQQDWCSECKGFEKFKSTYVCSMCIDDEDKTRSMKFCHPKSGCLCFRYHVEKNTHKINLIEIVFSIYHVCCHNSFLLVLQNLILRYLSWDGVIYFYSAPLCPLLIDIMIICLKTWYILQSQMWPYFALLHSQLSIFCGLNWV